MDVFLWIVAAVLAFAFGMSGVMKITKSYDDFKEQMAWAEDVSPSLLKFVGLMEILAALGLVLPPLFGIAEVLTPIAASGLVLIVVGAVVLHARRGETRFVFVNLFLGILALVVAWGRFGPKAF